MTPSLEASADAVAFSARDEADYLQLWFGDLAADAGSILFIRRFAKAAGGYTFKAVKGFRPDQHDAAIQFIRDCDFGDDLYIKTSSFDPDKINARIKAGEAVVGGKAELDTVVGFAMDVDAGKSDSYASQADVWEAIHQMPMPPSMVAISGHADHGFHVYYRFTNPIKMDSTDDVEILNQRAGAWRDLLCDKIAAILTARGVEGFTKDKLVDRTYGVDRVLRPVGAIRASGDRVKLVAFHPERRYTLTDLTVPGWEPPTPSGPDWPRAEESIIDEYFTSMEDSGTPITVENLLQANGYSPMMTEGDWIREGAETGSRSLAEGETINGLAGVNVFSGGCSPLKCNDEKNDVGRRYSIYALWVALTFGDVDQDASWSAAASFCHHALKPSAEEVFSVLEPDDDDDGVTRAITNGEKMGQVVIPRSMDNIVDQIRRAHGEWPKACQGDLFVIGKDGQARILDKTTKLFGWLNDGAQTIFHTAPNAISKGELFDHLAERVDAYESIEPMPHFPPIPRHFYLNPAPKPDNGRTLNRFLDFFAPATPADRELILAFIVTTFWGGPAGGRPMFAIDATSGTGTGKSALAFKIAKLSGHAYQFDQGTNEERLRSNLASDPAGNKRLVIMDNLKTTRVSSATIESLITAPDIGGHALHRGFRHRPNNLTWVITMNGLAMSRDLAHRTVKIIVTTPEKRDKWDERIDLFTELNRERLIADIAAFFDRDTVDLTSYGRWSAWEHAVLSRLESPEALQTLIKQRAGESDDDESSSRAILEYFGQRLADLNYCIEKDVIHIPLSICADWAGEATGRDLKRGKVSGMLKMLTESGSLQGIILNPSNKKGRGWLWNPVPESCMVNHVRFAATQYDLESRIRSEGFSEKFE